MNSCENTSKEFIFFDMVKYRSETKLSYFGKAIDQTHHGGLQTATTCPKFRAWQRLICPVFIKGILKINIYSIYLLN